MSLPERAKKEPKYGLIGRRTFFRSDPLEPQSNIAALVATKIIPRLALLHLEGLKGGKAVVVRFDAEDISNFARAVLRPDSLVADRQVSDLIALGLSKEQVFLDLFEPVARRLGHMWDNDECDLVDVTIGMGRLQRLLSTMESGAPAPLAKRSILMSTMPGEQQHSFGIAIVEKSLEAWGWRVRCERPASIDQIIDIIENNWIAVVGLSVSRTNGLETLARSISQIRRHSRNSAVGIMVGGPSLYDQPELAATIGADATARNASLAVLAAEKLFSREARRRRSIHRCDER
jgi:methanogenic corrinoid protein MtbC1